ncbi:MAG: helix-turn-helix domain-containing protein [Oscillospiraceae bacterium]|nr:helix-turn-helix domain-containing protein [Oscillospiraceae bacterium]
MKEQTLGEKIRDARKKAGLTQLQLAEHIFISESYIALIESDKRNPSTGVLSKIAEALGLTTDFILLGSSERSQESYINDWLKLINDRSPEEIETALRMIRSYFECLDDLNSGTK